MFPSVQMINEAITALKERTGSSAHAIAKYMDDKYRASLPANYKKMLSIQLRGFAAKGKLVKVKASYKLSDAAKKDSPKAKAKPAAKAAAAKPKKTASVAGIKRKSPGKKVMAKPKKSPAAKPKAKAKTLKSPASKKARKVAA
jgi:histone H1/5